MRDDFIGPEMAMMLAEERKKQFYATRDYLLTVIQTHIHPVCGGEPEIDRIIDSFEQQIRELNGLKQREHKECLTEEEWAEKLSFEREDRF